MQPIIKDVHGRSRFKENLIVSTLLENSSLDMNSIKMTKFSDEDRTQFAQLIGYSVDGFSELSYVSDEDVDNAYKAIDYSDSNENPLNDGHYHEAMDRCHVSICNLEEHLLSHPGITNVDNCKDLVTQAINALAEAYQLVGDADHKASLNTTNIFEHLTYEQLETQLAYATRQHEYFNLNCRKSDRVPNNFQEEVESLTNEILRRNREEQSCQQN